MQFFKSQVHKIILLILVSSFLYSCEKAGDIFNDPVNTFETGYYEMEFVIEESDKVGWQIFAEEVFSDNITTFLSQVGINEEQIEEILLKEAEISILESDNYDNFNNFKNIQLTVYTDDLGESIIAEMKLIPSDLAVLHPDLSDQDIYQYFKESGFMLTAQGYLQKRIIGNLKLRTRVKFQVKSRL